MKRLIQKYILRTTWFLTLMSFGNKIYALPDYTVLAPLPGIGPTTNLHDYLPNAFNLAIGIAAGMAFVVITLGGAMYATTDAISGKAQGKEWITNAIWGLLLVIGAWIILNTINPQILKFDLIINRPNIQAGQAAAVPGIPMTQQQIADDSTVKQQLKAGGVTFNNNDKACVNGEMQGCTNVNGLPQTAIDGLIALKKTSCSNCLIIVTGGTEPGAHASHGVGQPIVDLRPDPNLNIFIYGKTGAPADGYSIGRTWKDSNNRVHHASFTYETNGGNPNQTSTGPHWHVVINN